MGKWNGQCALIVSSFAKEIVPLLGIVSTQGSSCRSVRSRCFAAASLLAAQRGTNTTGCRGTSNRPIASFTFEWPIPSEPPPMRLGPVLAPFTGRRLPGSLNLNRLKRRFRLHW